MLAFLWFVWPPLPLLGAGVLLVLWANTRQRSGSLSAALAAAVASARRAYDMSREQPAEEQPRELHRIA